jgi:Na+-translocating ferredoxin:NAD+ oxidoreductase RnfC subunit
VVIPLKQHIGASAIPTVEKGMMVSEGTLIGKIEKGNLGANIHASISGVIKEITKEFITIEAEGVKI